jgi:uncharacterized membrane protein
MPQFDNNRLSLFVYLSVLLAAAAWTAGAIAVPVLEAHSIGGNTLSFLALSTYGRVCHQIPGRSFWIEGHPMAVCARCIGIYFGYVLAVIAYPLTRPVSRTETPPRIWLILGLTPAAIDFFVGYVGLVNNTGPSRFITGLIAGAVGVFYTLPGLVAMASELTATRRVEKLSAVGEKNNG